MDEFWDPEFDTRPWADLLRWQREQLPAYLTSLAQRSSYFDERLTGIDLSAASRADTWAVVPFMEKHDLRSAQATQSRFRLGETQAVPDSDIVQVIASSGTTGSPTFFGLTRRDREAWEFSIANMLFTAGIRSDSVVAHTVGMPMVAGGLPYADAMRRIGATLVWLGGQTPARSVDIMSRLQVDAMLSTASYATFLGERVEQELGSSAGVLGVRTVIGGGEPGLAQPQIREGLRDLWSAQRISETMGLGDVMSGLWAECPAERGMHFTGARNVMVELIDPDTGGAVDWTVGTRAEAVYTTFTREATPVVRYRSRDHLEIQDIECQCGRTAPLVRCVGRTDDMLIYKAMNVFPSAIRDVAMHTAGAHLTGTMRIRKSHVEQVRFEDPIPLELEVGTDQVDHDALAAQIAEEVRQKLRVRVAVEVMSPGSIPVSEYKNSLVYTGGEGNV